MNFKEKALLALLIVGLGDSLYLAFVYMGTAPLYCTVSGVVNCWTVESSSYSVAFGIPIAYAGVAWFAVALALFLLRRRPSIGKASGVWYVLGIGAAVYSLLSMYSVGAICEYCLLSDVVLVAVCAMELGRR